MPIDNERIARVEERLDTIIKNQDDGRERHHRIADELQVIAGQIGAFAAIKERQMEVIVTQKLHGDRITSLEGARDKVLTAWVIAKWIGWCAAGAFTVSVTVGPKLLKLLLAWAV